MTDIVERLQHSSCNMCRDTGTTALKRSCPNGCSALITTHDMELNLEAAAEIERLRAIMKELIAAGNEVAGWHRTDRLVSNPHEEWRAARDAARAALEVKE